MTFLPGKKAIAPEVDTVGEAKWQCHLLPISVEIVQKVFRERKNIIDLEFSLHPRR